MLDNNIYIYIYTNYITFTGFSSDWKHLKDLPLSWGVRKSLRIEVFMKSNHRQLPIVWRSSSRGWQDSWDPVGWQSPPSFPVEVRRCVFFWLPHQIWHSPFFASFWFGGIQYFKNPRKISPSQVLSNPVFRSPDSAQLGVFRKWFLERLLRLPMATSSDLIREAVQLRGGGRCRPDVAEEFCYFEMVVL